jgi:hypothetical protein
LGYSPGLIGIEALSDTGTALLAQSTSGLAGQFNGNVRINGRLTVTGGVSAAGASATTASASSLPHADGSQRQTLSLQTADLAVEDFGAATLTQGKATVKLDPDFAGLLKGAEYHVFLTPEGDCRGLYVAGKSATGFEVREQQGGTSSLPFSYRILAKLPNQGGKRLERVTPIATDVQQPDNAPKPVRPLPVPDVVKEDQKPHGGSGR